MKTFLIAAAFVLLGVAQATADANCRTIEDVIKYAENNEPPIRYTVLSTEHVVFTSPDLTKFMIVDFGLNVPCIQAHRILTREQFDAWLAGNGAGKWQD